MKTYYLRAIILSALFNLGPNVFCAGQIVLVNYLQEKVTVQGEIVEPDSEITIDKCTMITLQIKDYLYSVSFMLFEENNKYMLFHGLRDGKHYFKLCCEGKPHRDIEISAEIPAEVL